jgi:hypothetical protein
MAHQIVKSRSFATFVFGTRAWTMVRALLAASVIVSAPLAGLVSGLLQVTASPSNLSSTFLTMWGVCAMSALVISWTFGLAWHLLALRNDWRDGFSYLLAGVALGVAFGVVGLVGLMIPMVQSARALSFSLYVVLAAAAYLWLGSLLMGGTMWFAWLLRRPDRDATRSDIAGEFD